MKLNAKLKILISITFGILLILTPINANNNYITDNINKHSDSNNLIISAVSGKIHIKNNWTAVKDAIFVQVMVLFLNRMLYKI